MSMIFYLYLSLLLIAGTALWAIVSMPKHYMFKAFYIPIVMVTVLLLYYTYNGILGYATREDPPEIIQYIYHITNKDTNTKFLLGIEPKESEPRMFALPWNKELEENGYKLINLNLGYEDLIVKNFKEGVRTHGIQPISIDIVSPNPVVIYMERLTAIIHREYLTSIIEKEADLKLIPTYCYIRKYFQCTICNHWFSNQNLINFDNFYDSEYSEVAYGMENNK